jgi:large subunit ribosomal protein L25
VDVCYVIGKGLQHMAKQAELAVSPREITGKATKRLRRMGIIPANIFGHGEESAMVQLDAQAFEGLRRAHQATGLISLTVGETKRAETVLIRHVQHNPLNGKIVHIDFLRVGLRDRITAKVPLHFVGTAPGVKIEGGILLHLVEALEVECTADELVEAIEVDVSTLKHVEDLIQAKDVKLPANYTLITDPEEAVVKIMTPRVEKGEEVAEAAVASPAEESTGV